MSEDRPHQPRREDSARAVTLGFVVPMVIGAALGIITSDFFFWLTIGATIGVAVSSSLAPDERP